MKTGFLITARLKSTRLPKKLLNKVNGENFITWMVRRLKLAKDLDEIIICTSTNQQDDELASVAISENIQCFRGSEEDVIQRLYGAVNRFNLDYVINMTADCPMLPYDYIPNLIEQYKKTHADLIKCHNLPVGMYLSGLKPAAMKRLIEMKDSGLTEYWLYYFLKTDLFQVEELNVPKKFTQKEYRLALDYPEDYDFFKNLYEGLGDDAYKKTTAEIISYLDKNPQLAKINWDCNKKGEIRTRQDPTSKIKLKSFE